MDKLVINAVAGSGKTSTIVSQLDEIDNVALITYTRANEASLRNKILEKFGFIPQNLHVYSYFSFIYRVCFLPITITDNKGICFDTPNYYCRNHFTCDGRIYSNRLALFLNTLKQKEFLSRLNKYFDRIYIDEMQDFGSDDFDFLINLAKLDIRVTLVGDFYQRTFSTSQRGNKNKALKTDYTEYIKKLESAGYEIDEKSLTECYRCSTNVCDFVSTNLGINIFSKKANTTVRRINSEEEIETILQSNEIIKLFYQNHSKYRLWSNNWGLSKGEEYKHVCVVLNNTTAKAFNESLLHEMAPTTLCKFYVACTRTLGDLFFIDEKKIPDKYKR